MLIFVIIMLAFSGIVFANKIACLNILQIHGNFLIENNQNCIQIIPKKMSLKGGGSGIYFFPT